MDYHRGDTLVAQRTYAYDQLGRPTARTVTRQGSTRTDAYTYNNLGTGSARTLIF
ncbi:MAG: hypothetical protein Q4F30_09990 [Akkermansia sp.]|nr:hypothetical protein [Akkermansia sp.]